MEKEMQTSRKRLIKRIAIVFLIAMLILTFFSNTIMNYSLPEVQRSRYLRVRYPVRYVDRARWRQIQIMR